MTNLAVLVKAFPGVLQKIEKIVVMGGAIGVGNWSPAAEFNIMVDPEAAHIVLNCNASVVMVPL
jgi:pyrimidine-specific ribonucleoside hydrolase